MLTGAGVPSEKRVFERFHLDKRIKVKLGENGNGPVLHGRIHNIGEGGVAADLPQEVEMGEAVTLEFDAKPGQKVSLRAVVRHRRGFRLGMEFLALNSMQRELIRWMCLKEGKLS